MSRHSSLPYRDCVRRPQALQPGRWARLGAIALWVIVGALVTAGAWSMTSTTYFAFREDVRAGLIARQAEMQSAYEDRIAELRAQIDRFSSRQLIDQEEYEKKLEQILRRQWALESRAGALNGLGDTTAAIKQPARGGGSAEPRAQAPKPGRDKGAFMMAPDRGPDSRTVLGKGGIAGAIERLQASLDRLEQRQAATVGSLAERYDAKARRIRAVLVELGLDLGKASNESTAAVGGPFVPVNVAKDASTFERQLSRAQLARAQITRLTRTLGSIPVRKPIDGELDQQSGFGVRVDPFLSTPAMHTGLDLHGETGDVVRATGEGTVIAAGWNGGYGRTVDIDHHNGISTRYAHLSSIDVRVGQSVKCGQILGKVGSTGRSTGPHLHYETRLKGEPVDPQKFLRAGARLASAL
ncbi:MAG TPA: peptidoglycan DD-metalloendopeptidase family protein [Xanthobacteraceae bacterium]|jgi:murein DD-endopeptidase MepM/ murein hydrolase activator NlpD|nr:peptidoglycan DD-metalloendopeptidase family protein [Xanthobacteraceae bacterium]